MNYGVILAAGSGVRFGGEIPKVLKTIAGNTVLWHALKIFEAASEIDSMVLVVPQGEVIDFTEIVSEYNIAKSLDIVEGGETRMLSAYNGLKAVDHNCDIVAVHDAARIDIDSNIVDDAMLFAKEHGSALVSGPVFDTIKQVKSGRVVKTVDRSKLMAAHTPQIFRYKELMASYFDALSDTNVTDEALAMEKAGYPIHVFDTGKRGIKLTVEDDIYLVEAIKIKGEVLVGSGIDTHKLVEGRKLILGGVEIPFEKGLLGHSDADVLTHAIMDALLGAAGMHDIGYHFPDTDSKYKGASSIKLLIEVGKMLSKKGIAITNIDTTIVCQRPKIMPHGDEMKRNIADALNIDEARINIKATTTEGIGEHGEGKAISAMAICSLIKKN